MVLDKSCTFLQKRLCFSFKILLPHHPSTLKHSPYPLPALHASAGICLLEGVVQVQAGDSCQWCGVSAARCPPRHSAPPAAGNPIHPYHGQGCHEEHSSLSQSLAGQPTSSVGSRLSSHTLQVEGCTVSCHGCYACCCC